MKKKKIAIYGAFDRFNYGDLLFPIIIEKIILSHNIDYSVEYYGVIKSDLSKFGGIPTKSIKDLFRSSDEDFILIIAGGEVLGSTWNGIHLSLIENKFSILFMKILKKILGFKAANNLSRYMLYPKLLQPWIISPLDFYRNTQVIYNSVGGSSLALLPQKYQKDLDKKFNRSKYISVRDVSTLKALKNLNSELDVKLAPDCAILLSEFFPFNILEEKVNLETKSIINNQLEGYVVFQINPANLKGNEEILVNQLQSIYTNYGYIAVLLPIGRASQHEDQVALKRIKGLMKTPSIIPEENSIYDIMALIAKAKAFIGTSLHGIITATSFSVPYIAINKIDPKINSFIKTWGIPEQDKSVNFDEISSKLKVVLNISKDILNNKRDHLIKQSYENFREMITAWSE